MRRRESPTSHCPSLRQFLCPSTPIPRTLSPVLLQPSRSVDGWCTRCAWTPTSQLAQSVDSTSCTVCSASHACRITSSTANSSASAASRRPLRPALSTPGTSGGLSTFQVTSRLCRRPSSTGSLITFTAWFPRLSSSSRSLSVSLSSSTQCSCHLLKPPSSTKPLPPTLRPPTTPVSPAQSHPLTCQAHQRNPSRPLLKSVAPASLLYEGFDLAVLPSCDALRRKFTVAQLRAIAQAFGLIDQATFHTRKQPYLQLLWPLIQREQRLYTPAASSPPLPPIPSPPSSPPPSAALSIAHRLAALHAHLKEQRKRQSCNRQAVLTHQPPVQRQSATRSHSHK